MPYNQGLRILSEKPCCSNDGPYCSLHSCKKLGRAVLEKRTKTYKRTIFFAPLIPYNMGLRFLSQKSSDSKDGPYCPLHSCKKLGRSLELFWRKGQKKVKNTFF